MKALIVAAGKGKRLRPFTSKTPKPLIEVGGVSLIQRSIGALNARGITEITVVVGYLEKRVREALEDSVNYVVNSEFADTNNMMSLYLGREAMQDEPFLYLHSDLWYHPSIIDIGMSHPGEICFLIEEKLCGEEEMKVRVSEGLVIEADKAIAIKEAFGEWLGIIKFEPSGASAFFDEADRMLQQSKTLYDCAVVSGLAARGIDIHCVEIGKLPWVEIDFPDDLEYARSLGFKGE